MFKHLFHFPLTSAHFKVLENAVSAFFTVDKGKKMLEYGCEKSSGRGDRLWIMPCSLSVYVKQRRCDSEHGRKIFRSSCFQHMNNLLFRLCERTKSNCMNVFFSSCVFSTFMHMYVSLNHLYISIILECVLSTTKLMMPHDDDSH